MLPRVRLTATLVFLCAASLASACSLDWDALDPAQANGTGGSSADGGGAPVGGAAPGGGGLGGTANTVGGAGGSGGTGVGGGSGGSGGQGGSGGAVSLGPWGTPSLVAELNSDSFGDDDPTVTADGLEIFINRDKDIYTATRNDVASPWSDPLLVPELNTTAQDGNPVVSADGLSIWVSSYRALDGNEADIYLFERATRTSSWGQAQRLDELNTAAADHVSDVSADRLAMVFETWGAGDADLYWTSRTSTSAPWGTPVAIAELNSSDNDRQASMSSDQREIFFDSNRNGTTEIFVATRPDTSSPWSSPVAVTELDVASDASDPWLSDDRHHIFFVVGATGGDGEIFEAAR